MLASPTHLVVALLALAAVLPLIERARPAVAGQPRLRPGLGTDLTWWFFTPLVTKSLTALAIGLAIATAALALGVPLESAPLRALLAPRPPLGHLPLWLQAGLILLLADLVAYAMHRLLHVRPFLWRVHAVHHGSEALDWLSATRAHPLNDTIVRVAQALPIVALGLDPRLLAAWIPLLQLHSILLHANVPWSFGPLRRVIASPAFHRWHHDAAGGAGCNFAGLFPFLDVAFGTFHLPPGELPARVGAPAENVPTGLLGQLAFPFRRPHRVPHRVP